MWMRVNGTKDQAFGSVYGYLSSIFQNDLNYMYLSISGHVRRLGVSSDGEDQQDQKNLCRNNVIT